MYGRCSQTGYLLASESRGAVVSGWCAYSPARQRQPGGKAIRNRMSGHGQTTTCGTHSPFRGSIWRPMGILWARFGAKTGLWPVPKGPRSHSTCCDLNGLARSSQWAYSARAAKTCPFRDQNRPQIGVEGTFLIPRTVDRDRFCSLEPLQGTFLDPFPGLRIPRLDFPRHQHRGHAVNEDKTEGEDLDSTETVRPQSPVVPERVGPYRILERLGECGMGVVWRLAS